MTRATRETIAYGDYGATQTVERMRALANESLAVPIVVETARGIVSTVASRDYLAMAQAIRSWLSRNFKFIPDPVGVELLTSPEYQLRKFQANGIIYGDCDDAAVLGAALGKAVGIGARYVAVSFRPYPAPLTHIYTVLTGPPKRAMSIVDLDITKPAHVTASVQRAVTRTV
jgi:transglutaminase-like putative cysteine protease